MFVNRLAGTGIQKRREQFLGSREFVSIGNVKIEKTACLAPMASVADRAYRQLCREYGASYGGKAYGILS